MPPFWRRWIRKPKPSFEGLASSVVTDGEIIYERLAAELALVSIDGSIPDGLEESERMIVVLAGQLATIVAKPMSVSTLVGLEDLREELDDLREAIRKLKMVDPPTTISDARRHLVMFEVALRCFRNSAVETRP